MHIPDRARCNWLRERIETPDAVDYPIKRKVRAARAARVLRASGIISSVIKSRARAACVAQRHN